MKHLEENYDIVVVGAGHAGCEAALAGARLGLNTIMFTVSAESIALMPCNPNVGGSSKGHLVREIDAMGGAMGSAADMGGIQMRTLNDSKGPAVRSTRAQIDRNLYKIAMRGKLENQKNLDIFQEAADDLILEADGRCRRGRSSASASGRRSSADSSALRLFSPRGLSSTVLSISVCSTIRQDAWAILRPSVSLRN